MILPIFMDPHPRFPVASSSVSYSERAITGAQWGGRSSLFLGE